MLSPHPVYLVRHGHPYGDTGRRPGHLSQSGEQDHAIPAGRELVRMGLGRASIVLTTRLYRSLETGEIIAAMLGAEMIEGSREFSDWSRDLVGPSTLDEMVEAELARANLRPDDLDPQDGRIILASHTSVIAPAPGDVIFRPSKDGVVEYGSIKQYTPGTWPRPN